MKNLRSTYLGGVGKGDGTQAVGAREFDGARHGGVCGKVAGTKMPVPAFERAEPGDTGWGNARIDAAVGDHALKARETVETMGVDAVAGGFSNETSAEGGTIAFQARAIMAWCKAACRSEKGTQSIEVV